jgi:hypothetical protein
MPHFLDIHHHAQGMTLEEVAAAHARDVAIQQKHGVTFVRYWYDAKHRQDLLPDGRADARGSRGGTPRGAWGRGGRNV